MDLLIIIAVVAAIIYVGFLLIWMISVNKRIANLHTLLRQARKNDHRDSVTGRFVSAKKVRR